MRFQDLIEQGHLVKDFNSVYENCSDEKQLNTGGFIHYDPPSDTVLKLIDDDGGIINHVTRIRPYYYWNDEDEDPNAPDCWAIEIEGREDVTSRVLDHDQKIEIYKRI